MSRRSTKQRRAARRRHASRKFRVSFRFQVPIPGTGLAFSIRDPRLATPEIMGWLEDCARLISEEVHL